jgi:hypothetical protein
MERHEMGLPLTLTVKSHNAQHRFLDLLIQRVDQKKMTAYKHELESMYANLKFEKKLWFSCSDIDSNAIVEMVSGSLENFRTLDMGSDEAQGIMDLLTADFIREIWVSEVPDDYSFDQTVDTANILIESRERPSFCTDIAWKKVQNIYNAAIYLSKCDPSEMNMHSILSVHQYVADGLITHPVGELRQKDVGAANTSITYLPHHKVESRVRGLIEFTGDSMKRRYSHPKEIFLHPLKIGSSIQNSSKFTLLWMATAEQRN